MPLTTMPTALLEHIAFATVSDPGMNQIKCAGRLECAARATQLSTTAWFSALRAALKVEVSANVAWMQLLGIGLTDRIAVKRLLRNVRVKPTGTHLALLFRSIIADDLRSFLGTVFTCPSCLVATDWACPDSFFFGWIAKDEEIFGLAVAAERGFTIRVGTAKLGDIVYIGHNSDPVLAMTPLQFVRCMLKGTPFRANEHDGKAVWVRPIKIEEFCRNYVTDKLLAPPWGA